MEKRRLPISIGADLVLPESSVKPLAWSCHRSRRGADECRLFRQATSIIGGCGRGSRTLEFGSSYTVLQHASREVIECEIIPKASLKIPGAGRSVADEEPCEGPRIDRQEGLDRRRSIR